MRALIAAKNVSSLKRSQDEPAKFSEILTCLSSMQVLEHWIMSLVLGDPTMVDPEASTRTEVPPKVPPEEGGSSGGESGYETPAKSGTESKSETSKPASRFF